MQFIKHYGAETGASRAIILATIIAFFASILGALVVATHLLPLTDGWYEVLIFLESKGLHPYSDVEFILPPITPLFYAAMDALTGSNLAAHKIIGVFLSLFDAGLIYIWLVRANGKAASLLTAFAFFPFGNNLPHLYSA